MKTMRLVTISHGGVVKAAKYVVDDWIDNERFASGVMCWYTYGTKLIVKDTLSGKIEVFVILKDNDEVSGFAKLVRLDNFNNLEGLFALIEMEV